MGYAKPRIKKAEEATCKLCNHEYRIEIETKIIVEEKSYREVYIWLNDISKKLSISRATMSRHMRNHVDAKREVQIRYLADRAKLKDEVTEGVSSEVSEKLSTLKKLDRSINEANELVVAASHELKRQLKIKIPRQIKIKDDKGKDTGKVFKYDKVEVSHSVVQLFKGAAEELRQTSKTKMEILGIDAKTKATDSIATLVDMIVSESEEE